MVKKTLADVAKESSPPALITGSSLAGVGWDNWVYILTAIYIAVQLLRLMPRVIGCGQCFIRQRGCQMQCKQAADVELRP